MLLSLRPLQLEVSSRVVLDVFLRTLRFRLVKQTKKKKKVLKAAEEGHRLPAAGPKGQTMKCAFRVISWDGPAALLCDLCPLYQPSIRTAGSSGMTRDKGLADRVIHGVVASNPVAM